MGDTAVTCPHGDPMCPCNDDGAACHYEPLEVAGAISPASKCTNPACAVCQ